jgi:hypothetical protein
VRHVEDFPALISGQLPVHHRCHFTERYPPFLFRCFSQSSFTVHSSFLCTPQTQAIIVCRGKTCSIAECGLEELFNYFLFRNPKSAFRNQILLPLWNDAGRMLPGQSGNLALW